MDKTSVATVRTRWAAIGAAIAITLGAGGIGITRAISTNGGAVFVPVPPCRLFDTRPAPENRGPRSTPLRAGEIHTQQVTGDNGDCTAIPTDATAISLNVTTVGSTADSFLTVFPADLTTPPLASNLNWRAGDAPTPNKVDVKLSPTGAVKLYNLDGTVNVLADVVGYYQNHNHDDRYYTEAEVDALLAAQPSDIVTQVYFAQSASWEQPAAVTQQLSNECMQNTTTAGIYVWVPLELPVGSKLLSVDTAVLDAAGSTSYTVNVRRATITSAGTAFVNLYNSATLGGSAGLVHTIYTPTTNEVMQPTTNYYVRVGSFQNSSNAFCSVAVTYDTNP